MIHRKIADEHLSIDGNDLIYFPHFSSFLLCRSKGIQKLMVPGTSVKSSKEALRLTRLYPGSIYSTAGMCELSFFGGNAWLKIHNQYSAGIHPHDSKSIVEEPESWQEYETIANQPECVAIGPCGLDYQRDFSEPHVQKTIFEKQLQLAVQLRKPVLIHERSAHTDVLDILSKYVLQFSCTPRS